MGRRYSAEIAEEIQNYLDTVEWKYQKNEDDGIFEFNLSLSGQLRTLSYLVGIYESNYIVYASCPVYADPRNSAIMTNMMQFLCMVNYRLINGNFEMDVSDGEIRYKCYVDCKNMKLSRAVIESSLFCPGSMFECYGKGIMRILFGEMGAEEAVCLCEGLSGSFCERESGVSTQEAAAEISVEEAEAENDSSRILYYLERMQEEG